MIVYYKYGSLEVDSRNPRDTNMVRGLILLCIVAAVQVSQNKSESYFSIDHSCWSAPDRQAIIGEVAPLKHIQRARLILNESFCANRHFDIQLYVVLFRF